MIRDENTRVTIIMPKKLYKLIKNDAEYEDRSMSNLIVKILKHHYKFESDSDENE